MVGQSSKQREREREI
jgi:hypothetical protein